MTQLFVGGGAHNPPPLLHLLLASSPGMSESGSGSLAQVSAPAVAIVRHEEGWDPVLGQPPSAPLAIHACKSHACALQSGHADPMTCALLGTAFWDLVPTSGGTKRPDSRSGDTGVQLLHSDLHIS